jgi:esterase
MPTVAVNGIHLYQEEQGSGDAIVLIHGTSSSALVWRASTRESLADLGRVIVYDRRGSSRSERPEPYATSVDEQAVDAIGLLEALDAGPAVLIGRSYGGAVALGAALRRPDLVRALVLLEPGDVTLDGQLAAWEEPLTQAVEAAAGADPATAAEAMIRSVLGDEAWESLPPEWQGMFASNSPAVLAEVRGKRLEVSRRDLARLAIPTLLVVGEASTPAFAQLARTLADAIPGSRVVNVAGGHIVDPAEPAVLDYVRDVLRASP